MTKFIQAGIACALLAMGATTALAQQEPSGVKYVYSAFEGATEEDTPKGLEVIYVASDKITLQDKRVIHLKQLDQRRDVSETDTLYAIVGGDPVGLCRFEGVAPATHIVISQYPAINRFSLRAWSGEQAPSIQLNGENSTAALCATDDFVRD